MDFFIDCEATSPENEIIRVTVRYENGVFDSLVRPQHSVISPFITQLTGIKNSDYGSTIEEVLDNLYIHMISKESDISKWKVYAYGKDNKFFVNSIADCHTHNSIILCTYLSMLTVDVSNFVFSYFRHSLPLRTAYEYVAKQNGDYIEGLNHDSFYDTLMLKYIYNYTKDKEPLECVLEAIAQKPEDCYIYPSGKFFIKTCGKNAKEREFANIHELMDYLIDLNIEKKMRDKVRKDRMAIKIMRALKKKTMYMGYYIRREK